MKFHHYKRSALLAKVLLVAMLMLCSLSVSAQGKKRPPFNPKKFQADLEQYITVHAGLTPTEAAQFFPLYRQMADKQRTLFDEMRRIHFVNPRDNEACAKSIRRQDELDIEMKQLQQYYHGRFMLILPPSKVFSIIKAEEKFHREMFKKMR